MTKREVVNGWNHIFGETFGLQIRIAHDMYKIVATAIVGITSHPTVHMHILSATFLIISAKHAEVGRQQRNIAPARYRY